MKILITHPCWHRLEIGGSIEDGIGGYISTISQALTKQGHELHIICTDDSVDLTNDPNITLHKLGAISGTGDNYQHQLPWRKYNRVVSEVLRSVKDFDFIYNQAQNEQVIKAIYNRGLPIVHYSHGNPDKDTVKMFGKYPNLLIATCGRANHDIWTDTALELKLNLNIFRNDLVTDIESWLAKNDYAPNMSAVNPNRFLLVSRVFSRDKGIIDFLEVAKTNPDKEFILIGSRCNVETTVKIKSRYISHEFYDGELFEEVVNSIINFQIPNLKWINYHTASEPPKFTRDIVLEYMLGWDGFFISFSSSDAGVTTGVEARALGLPIFCMNNPKSNMRWHAAQSGHNHHLNSTIFKSDQDSLFRLRNGIVANVSVAEPDRVSKIKTILDSKLFLDGAVGYNSRSEIRLTTPTTNEHIQTLLTKIKPYL